MHVGLICPELTGHLNPLLTLGRELRRRGHRVSLVASSYSRPAAERFELEFVELPTVDSRGWDIRGDWQAVGVKSGIRALIHTIKILRRLAMFVRDRGLEPVREAGIEALVVDQFSTGGALVADQLALPMVIACNALASHRDVDCPPPTMPWRYRPTWWGRWRNRLAYEAGRRISDGVLGRRPPGFVSPLMLMNDPEPWGLAQVSQQPEFFDFPRPALPNHFHYTGPWHEAGRDSELDFPWDRLDGRPLIYASLGTLQNKLRDVYQAIVHAVSGMDAQLVLALGSRDATLDLRTSSNAIVVPYAPQLRLLSQATVAITHAGLNTALECLAHGVPMVCIPVTNDQPGVARRVEWLGAGRYLPLRQATEARVREALRAVLEGPTYRQAARECQERMRRVPGLTRAADIIEEAFRTGRRVRSR